MHVSELDYNLPEDLIARYPTPQRRGSRLLAVDRNRRRLTDLRFADLPTLLRPDDLLVVNNTRVVPAKFVLRRSTGGRIEGLWLGSVEGGLWHVLLRGAARLKLEEVLRFEQSADRYQAVVVAKGHAGEYRLQVMPPTDPHIVLNEVGLIPLPPYIKRNDDRDEELDRERYQTVYAKEEGAVAAPTAGLHFDAALLRQLCDAGIELVEVTLHVGLGTFQPIEVDLLEDHCMHSERYEVADEVWKTVQEAKGSGRRVVAVGTTSVRVLETVARSHRLRGETSIFIYPPCTFAVADGLITNFHLPRSTLLAMICAFGGTQLMRQAYAHAIERKYRFYSYGDAMLIE